MKQENGNDDLRWYNQVGVKHVLSASQFSRGDLARLFRETQDMERDVEMHGRSDIFARYVIALLFGEPSTRTRVSFETAILRGGGEAVYVDSSPFSSQASTKKGESLRDTVETLARYCDAIVIRDPTEGTVGDVSKFLIKQRSIINAGDGVGEHPTQALLDLYTLWKEFGRLDGLTVGLLGDLKNGRTVHALVQMLCMYHVKVVLISPEILRMPDKFTRSLKESSIEYLEGQDLAQYLPLLDVLYVTRVQRERFATPEEYDKVKDSYVVTPDTLGRAKDGMIVMHPLPRVGEIAYTVDRMPQARHFDQLENGMFVRMALLDAILNNHESSRGRWHHR